jgi:SAM-dependent methyltransferase
MLYTPGTPRTLLQLWQRCYFEDLWEAMGDCASAARYLELGCGRATTSMYLASRECDVTLVDLAPEALELARNNFRASGLPLPNTVLADAQDTRLDTGAFNCVYNIGLLEHFDDPLPVIKESARLLRSGGVLFSVIVPPPPPWLEWIGDVALRPWRIATRSMRRLRALATARSQVARRGMIRTDYPSERYEQWGRAAGLRDVRCIPYNPYLGLGARWLDDHVLLPAYQTHRRLARGKRPTLITRDGMALCQLLVGIR